MARLRQLLAQAQRGEITGIAYVVLKPAGGYTGDVLGTSLTHPLIALGTARALEHKIANLLK